MKKLFNIAGPCIPGKHYIVPILERCPDVMRLIEDEQYFVLHAARQTGKTTLLNALEHELNLQGNYVALYCSLETVQGISDPEKGIPLVVRALQQALRRNQILAPVALPAPDMSDYSNVVATLLTDLAAAVNKPVVVFFDEADCLSDQSLITFLRQLRDGYVNRIRAPFPSSIALVGMRDIRDYKAKIRPQDETLGSASPFNVITESLTLGTFSCEDIESLYLQHTNETGQQFEKVAINRTCYWTNGQPWLVNAIARECVDKILHHDYSSPITVELIDQAAHNIIQRRDTHIDSLLERLKEERVRRVVEPVILGKQLSVDYSSDDRVFCLDLGLLKDNAGILTPANPIYAEVILRTLSFGAQMEMQSMVPNTPWISEDRIDMNNLLKSFQQFWRENSEAFTNTVITYKEAAPHLMLQAFLQRVINGGGHIIREFALGSMRLDLLVVYKAARYPIEIKLEYQMNEKATRQLLAYMDRTTTHEGWLVVFDRSTEKTWDEKIRWETQSTDDKTIHVVWC